ncbi:unnamed protein product [Trichogramma brassicae]|uniref:Uncharacterized protein n=1 Tax=Trichogramma brassicae TaxID=86971 RepID=A0A6H5J0U2_9HYME|nr:unnamed protein product [Trichogramma brassicae]
MSDHNELQWRPNPTDVNGTWPDEAVAVIKQWGKTLKNRKAAKLTKPNFGIGDEITDSAFYGYASLCKDNRRRAIRWINSKKTVIYENNLTADQSKIVRDLQLEHKKYELIRAGKSSGSMLNTLINIHSIKINYIYYLVYLSTIRQMRSSELWKVFLPLEKYNAMAELLNPQLDKEQLVHVNDTEHLDEIVKSVHISQRGNIVIIEITLTTMWADTPDIYSMTPYKVMQHEKMIAIILLILMCSARISLSIYGFDCGTRLTNITTISLVDVGECDITTPEVEIDKINAQLIQINDYGMIHVRECRLLMKRTIFYCGMHSHVSPAANGEVAFYKEMSRDECDLLQVTGTYNGFDKRIVNIKRNDTTTTMTFAGKINPDKSCEAASSYEDPYGTFDNVVMQGFITIQNKGLRSKNRSHDEQAAPQLRDKGDSTIMYTLETGEYSFSLLRKSEENICGTTFVRLDIFAYINSKFVCVDKHLKGQIKQMYQNIMKSKCDLERRVIENALSIAAMAPAEAGHKIMKEEGYLAIPAGESLHLLRCRRVIMLSVAHLTRTFTRCRLRDFRQWPHSDIVTSYF